MGRRAGISPTVILGLDEDGSPAGPGRKAGAGLGVPNGVAPDLGGMLGGGGVPVYCARRKRGLGEADDGVPKTGGVPSAVADCAWRGLGMSNGREGEVMVVEVDE